MLALLAVTIGCGADSRDRADTSARTAGAPARDEAIARGSAAATSGAPNPDPAAARPARRELAADEERGGHTIARHVGRSDDDLRQRLRRERIAAASTYDDLQTAEHVVGAALEQTAPTIEAWERRAGSRPNLAVRYRGDPADPIGRSVLRGRRDPVACYDAVVVLRWDDRSREYFVLTSYPEARR